MVRPWAGLGRGAAGRLLGPARGDPVAVRPAHPLPADRRRHDVPGAVRPAGRHRGRGRRAQPGAAERPHRPHRGRRRGPGRGAGRPARGVRLLLPGPLRPGDERLLGDLGPAAGGLRRGVPHRGQGRARGHRPGRDGLVAGVRRGLPLRQGVRRGRPGGRPRGGRARHRRQRRGRLRRRPVRALLPGRRGGRLGRHLALPLRRGPGLRHQRGARRGRVRRPAGRDVGLPGRRLARVVLRPLRRAPVHARPHRDRCAVQPRRRQRCQREGPEAGAGGARCSPPTRPTRSSRASAGSSSTAPRRRSTTRSSAGAPPRTDGLARALRADLDRSDVTMGPVTRVLDLEAANEATAQGRLPDAEDAPSEMGWIVFCVAVLAVLFLFAGFAGQAIRSWRYPNEHDPRDQRLDLFRGVDHPRRRLHPHRGQRHLHVLQPERRSAPSPAPRCSCCCPGSCSG